MPLFIEIENTVRLQITSNDVAIKSVQHPLQVSDLNCPAFSFLISWCLGFIQKGNVAYFALFLGWFQHMISTVCVRFLCPIRDCTLSAIKRELGASGV